MFTDHKPSSEGSVVSWPSCEGRRTVPRGLIPQISGMLALEGAIADHSGSKPFKARTVPGAGDVVRNHHPPVQSLLLADRSLSSPKRGKDSLEVTQQVHLRAGLERRAPGTLNSADYASAVVRVPQVT